MKRKYSKIRKGKMAASVCAMAIATAVTAAAITPSNIWAAGTSVAATAQSDAFTLEEDTNTTGLKGLWKDISPEGATKGTHTYQIRVKISDNTVQKSDISWQSSDPSIASVDKDGLVTGHKIGHVDITASVGEYSQKFGINVIVPSDEPYTISNGTLSYASASLGRKYHLGVSTDKNVKWDGPVASGTQNVLSISDGAGTSNLYLAENVPCTFQTTPAQGLTGSFSLEPSSAGTVQRVSGDPGKVIVTLHAPATLHVSTTATVFAKSVKAMDDFVMKVGETVTLTDTITPASATVAPSWKYDEQTSFWTHYMPGLDTEFDGCVTFDGKKITAITTGLAHFTVSADSANGKSVSDQVQVRVVDPNTKLFDDVRDMEKYYYTPVYWGVEQDITSGTSENLFSPDLQVTRGQMVTFLWRAAGSPEPDSSANPFSDVTEDSPYYQAILWAYQNGITEGMSDTVFGSNEKCTRAQIVTFLYNFEDKPSASVTSEFSDAPENAYYHDAVSYAVSKGITNGTGNDRFSPNETCTRGQAMTFLYRAQK